MLCSHPSLHKSFSQYGISSISDWWRTGEPIYDLCGSAGHSFSQVVNKVRGCYFFSRPLGRYIPGQPLGRYDVPGQPLGRCTPAATCKVLNSIAVSVFMWILWGEPRAWSE